MKHKKIQWNAVTWYSKALAVIMFVSIPVFTFMMGNWYGYIKGEMAVRVALFPAMSSQPLPASAPKHVWLSQELPSALFTFKTPFDAEVRFNGNEPTAKWRNGSNSTNGVLYATMVLPKLFEPMTNFQGATLTVGSSDDVSAVGSCLAYQPMGGEINVSTVKINDIDFRMFNGTDAGAGNRYEITSYRTVHDGKCYAIEYLIHSTNLSNYPEEYGLHEFNNIRVTSYLESIVHTFAFK